MTKFPNLLKLFPPKRLRRKLGNHSPVYCGTKGRLWILDDGDPLGVMEEDEPSLLLDGSGFVRFGGDAEKSAVNFGQMGKREHTKHDRYAPCSMFVAAGQAEQPWS